MPPKKKTASRKSVETLVHEEASRKHIPTAEYQSVLKDEDKEPIRVAYERRNRDLDPQLVWRGKDEQDWSDLVVQAPPLYIQEKVHPKALIDDLRRRSVESEKWRVESGTKSRHSALSTRHSGEAEQLDLFSDFNGIPEDADKTDFYQHDANWSNRMLLGDSLQVMASLAEREGLRGKVQCFYFDPPYGIKFNSNFQWSTTSRDVKDGKADHITREPEQVKAFRDTWRDGIHSYLTYLRDRLTVARDLLTESGSIFVQIGDENVHRVRALMDEVFGEENFIAIITVQKTGGLVSEGIVQTLDFLLWYGKSRTDLKTRLLYWFKEAGDTSLERYDLVFDSLGTTRSITQHERFAGHPEGTKRSQLTSLESANPRIEFEFQGKPYKQRWKTNEAGFRRLDRAGRVKQAGESLRYLRHVEDFPVVPVTDRWESMQIADEITIHSPLTTHHYAQVHVRGVDVFDPATGEVRSDGPDGIACWFIDTDYNEESFFVRHAYFLGQNDPYKSLKTTLKAEINPEAWETLHSDTSRPFDKPTSGRIAVKVINHLGDEVMKVFRV